MEFWNDYSLKELDKLIKEKPLTKERINYVLQNKIENIEFSDIFEISQIMPYNNNKYIIFISLQQPLEEREISLIHEICHAYYKVGGITASTPWFGPERRKAEKIEKRIDEEAQRFYKENKDFVKELYLRLSSEPDN